MKSFEEMAKDFSEEEIGDQIAITLIVILSVILVITILVAIVLAFIASFIVTSIIFCTLGFFVYLAYRLNHYGKWLREQGK